MRILFISGELIGSALCKKLVDEGNDVKLYIQGDDWKKCLDGIVPKSDNWRSELDWVGKDGLIVFDDVIFGDEQDRLRELGYKVMGGSAKGDLLELDRRHFQEVAKNHGIETLPSYNFSNAQEAINFVESNRSRWVVKQSSHISSLNYVGNDKNGNDVLKVLQRYKKLNISPIHVQQHASGIEVGVARYFNGNDWVGPIEVNHEYKRLNDGDLGPLTPEMGTVLWYTNDEIRLFTETLGKLKPHLQEINFKGDIDINCIVTKDKALPLEATPRFGSPSTEIHVALHTSPWANFLRDIADGNVHELSFKNGFGIVVSIAVAPFPFAPDNESRLRASQEIKNISFSEDITSDDFSHIHFEEVSSLNNTYHWSGSHGWVLHVTATGDTIESAQKEVYERVKKIKIDGSYYRKDIGTRVKDNDIPKLKEWGWLDKSFFGKSSKTFLDEKATIEN